MSIHGNLFGLLPSFGHITDCTPQFFRLQIFPQKHIREKEYPSRRLAVVTGGEMGCLRTLSWFIVTVLCDNYRRRVNLFVHDGLWMQGILSGLQKQGA